MSSRSCAPPKVVAQPVTRKGIAVKVGLVALLLGGAYVGVSLFMADLGL